MIEPAVLATSLKTLLAESFGVSGSTDNYLLDNHYSYSYAPNHSHPTHPA
jgi:hypothetical protein